MWIKSNGVEFRMEDKLYNELQKITIQRMKEKDNNKIILVCGDTGSGKSAFAFQCGAVIDLNFSLKNIAFTTNETKDYIKKLLNKFIAFDEAFRGISGRNTMAKSQKELMQMLYEVRQLNQVIFLVTPSFFRLDEAIAVELSDAMFYIYKTGTKKDRRRAYRMFNNKQKNRLYYKAKKGIKSYSLVPSLFAGTFPKTYVVDEKAYRKKKFDSLFKTNESDKEEKKSRIEKERENLLIREAIFLEDKRKQLKSALKVSLWLKEQGVSLSPSTIKERTTLISQKS